MPHPTWIDFIVFNIITSWTCADPKQLQDSHEPAEEDSAAETTGKQGGCYFLFFSNNVLTENLL